MTKCFRYDDDVEIIDVGDTFWVGLKGKMSYGDHQKFSMILIESGGEIITDEETRQKKVMPTSEGIEASDIALMLMNIKEWSLTDNDGQVAPIDKAHIECLDPDIGAIISNDILLRNPTLR